MRCFKIRCKHTRWPPRSFSSKLGWRFADWNTVRTSSSTTSSFANSCMIHGILAAKQPVRSAETSGLLRSAWAYRKGKLLRTDRLEKIMSSNMDIWSKLNHARRAILVTKDAAFSKTLLPLSHPLSYIDSIWRFTQWPCRRKNSP